MRLVCALLLSVLPLTAQQINPPDPSAEEPAPIGPVTPVPLPTEADLIDAEALAPAEPQSVKLDLANGFDYDKESETMVVRGAISATTDTGMTLRADRGRYEGKVGRIYADGSVKVRTETGVEIFADHAVLDEKAETVTLTGNVSIYQGQTLQRGNQVIYHMGTQQIDASNLKTGVDPLLLEAGNFVVEERDGKQVFVGRDAGVTTHDVEDPGFWIRSSETTVYPDDRVSFRNMKVYAGDTPIFWLPYFSQPLDGDLGYHFVPGARSNWGGYLLNSYGVMLGKGDDATGNAPWLLSRWNFDLRTRRGVAAGVDLLDRRTENPNLTGLSTYYAHDINPEISRTGLPRPPLSNDRWRAKLAYRIPFEFESTADWRLDFNLDALSDNYFLEDFDPRTFRTDPNPDNTIGIYRRNESSLLSLFTRVRPNTFYRSDTRLPELSFDQARRPIFGTGILHEGKTSVGFIREEIGSATAADVRTLLALPPGSPLAPAILSRIPPYERQLVQTIRNLPAGSPFRPALANQLLDPGFNRFNTYQELSYPTTLGGWLHLTPEIGAGYTHYWSTRGPFDSLSRVHFYAGAEASMKFSKNFGNFVSRRWGLDGLLHVAQPYTSFSYVNTDDLNPLYPAIDRQTFTTRPHTLSPNRFTAVDSLRDWSIFRLGMRNRLLTKRDGQTFEWFSIDTYMDAFLEDPDFDRSFSNLYNDIRWNPLPWLGTSLETQFPFLDDGSGYSEVVARLRYMPHENVEFAVGNRFLNDHPVLVDSNRVDLSGYVRLNDKWGLGALQVWELDDNVLEIQQYTVHRDFNHWVASVGFTKRDNRIDDEYGVILSFTLKDFPSASLPLSMDAQ